jgi:hypothetical protein
MDVRVGAGLNPFRRRGVGRQAACRFAEPHREIRATQTARYRLRRTVLPTSAARSRLAASAKGMDPRARATHLDLAQ